MVDRAATGRAVGRYALYDEIAAGGMATVHVGRLLGPVGFSRTVAIKCLHPQLARDPEFVAMFLDEARLAARIRHPNVVATIDVVALEGEVFLVMEYVQGESLSRLIRTAGANAPVPPAVASAIVCDALSGLHAAHEATTENGEALGIVHRDVSPQNILVGADGASRVLDFGIAKAATRAQTTREGVLKGKLRYMSPEQLTRRPVDRRTDVFAMSIVLWEALTGHRLFAADDAGGTVASILTDVISPPSMYIPSLSAALDTVILRGLARNPAERFASAREMALALERALPPARPARVGEWVESIAGESLGARATRVAQIEASISGDPLKAVPADGKTAPTLRVIEAPSSESTAIATIGTARSIDEPPGKARSVRIRTAALAIVVVLGAVSVGFFASRVSSGSAPTAAASVAPSSSTPLASSAPEGASSALADTSLAPPASADAVPAPVSTHNPTVQRPVILGPPRKKHSADCDPPYYFDADRVKRFKPNCLY